MLKNLSYIQHRFNEPCQNVNIATNIFNLIKKSHMSQPIWLFGGGWIHTSSSRVKIMFEQVLNAMNSENTIINYWGTLKEKYYNNSTFTID